MDVGNNEVDQGNEADQDAAHLVGMDDTDAETQVMVSAAGNLAADAVHSGGTIDTCTIIGLLGQVGGEFRGL